MTETRTYAPATTPTAQPWWKAVVVVLAVVLGLPAAVVAGFAALVVWSGCFISCGEPDPVSGFGLGVLAAVLLALGPALAWLLYRRWAAVAYACLAMPVAALLVLPVLLGVR